MDQSAEKKPKIEKAVVLISGCSSGIGLTTAVHLATNSKYKVYATLRDMSKKDKILESAKSNNIVIGESLSLLEMDVTKEDTIVKAVKQILESEGKIDVLICNAGYAFVGLLETTPIEEVKKIFDTNVFGVVRLIQNVLPCMRKNSSGKIIAISSISGVQAEPGLDIYNATKFALEALFEAQAPLMKKLGIHYVLVQPGMVQSELANNAKASMFARKPLLVDDGGMYDRFCDGYSALFEQNFMFADPADDLAKMIQTVIETENPNLRYQFTQVAEETAKSKLVDPTGNSIIEQSSVAIGYILPEFSKQ